MGRGDAERGSWCSSFVSLYVYFTVAAADALNVVATWLSDM
jgi:hypothetical protein